MFSFETSYKKKMNIYGKKVMLRAIEFSDCKLICEMFNDPEIEDLVVGWAFPISQYQQEKWYEKNYLDSNFRFIVELEGEGAVGIATLSDIDWKNRMAHHGIKLSRKSPRGKGIGTDVVMAIMRYAFDELGLNRLNGSWFRENEVSRKMYMNCGWKEEGIRRNYIYKKGKYRDLIETGILAEEYYDLVAQNRYWESSEV